MPCTVILVDFTSKNPKDYTAITSPSNDDLASAFELYVAGMALIGSASHDEPEQRTPKQPNG
jgi:hypothetical protein